MSSQPLDDTFRPDASSPDDVGPDELIVPGSPAPLSPGRVTLNPDREAGADELPNPEGNQPHGDDDAGLDSDLADMDLTNAEFDDQPNPR
jgi:hypothetical protein